MIDEVYEVDEYLRGKPVTKNGMYRALYLMAKWFNQEGYSPLETRKYIFEWANKHRHHIAYNLNSIIYKAQGDNKRLRDNICVKISRGDVAFIKERLDSRNAKMLALALLCYAKANADKNGMFSVPMNTFGDWVGIKGSNISSRYLPELESFGVVERIEDEDAGSSWNKKEKYKCTRLKMKCPLYNAGVYELHNNGIQALYEELF